MARTYFSDCKTSQEVKSEYRRLAMKYHPDRGGDAKIMTAINRAYKQALERVATDSQKRSGNGTFENLDDGYMAIINTIIAMDGVELELCGLWLWLSGNTRPHKEEIKKLGFKWASKKKKWYWRPEWYQRRGNRKEWDMTDIRNKYGSVIIDAKVDDTPRIEQ